MLTDVQNVFGRSNKPETNYVTAFLSCSVRSADRQLVDAIDQKVLFPMGFRCLTVGRNISLPDQVDDAIRDLIDQVDCLIGIATLRLEATEQSLPDRTLKLASPYILQESAMAHQHRIPFLIFKTPEVTLQGIMARNLYLEIQSEMPNGKACIPVPGRACQVMPRRAKEAGPRETKGAISTRDIGSYWQDLYSCCRDICSWFSFPVAFATKLFWRFLLQSS